MQAHVSVAIDASGSTDNAPVPAFELTSNEGVPLAALPHLTALGERCQVYMRRALAEQADPPAHLSLYPDPLQGVSIAPRPRADDVRLVFFVLASRPSAPALVSRLVRALYSPVHLFLVHVDLKANASVHEALVSYASTLANVHVLKTRRLVQWGGFSMVTAMLDAMASFVQRVDFDFFINLSDSELPLRTSEELTAFLGRFKGRAFVHVDPPPSAAGRRGEGGDAATSAAAAAAAAAAATVAPRLEDDVELEQFPSPSPSQRRRHAFWGGALRRHSVIECGGFGFVSVNSSANSSLTRRSSGPACCYGQSGPLLHAAVPFAAPEPPRPSYGEFRGTQWAILPASLCRYLIAADCG